MRKRLFVITVLLCFSSTLLAAEKVKVCAKYRANYGWSTGYKVEANVLNGSELNAATNSMNYNAISTYVVIFWDEGQASVIELDFPFLSMVGQTGTDQQGRQWEIAKTLICY